MNLLLDTHIALWAVQGSPRLSARARELIGEAGTSVVVSAATVWEIGIKHPLRRGTPDEITISAANALRFFKGAGYRLLPITPEHTVAVEQLPRHHGDPFDRIIGAQAISEPMKLLTKDALLARYSELVILV